MGLLYDASIFEYIKAFFACALSPFAYPLYKTLTRKHALLNTLQMAVSLYFRLERCSRSLP